MTETSKVIGVDVGGTFTDLSLLDEAGVPALAWRLAKAVPTKLEAPTFDAAANDVAIESLELKARGISLVQT